MNYTLHCFKHAFNQVVELSEFDSIDEVNFFSLCIESELELINVVILINNTEFGIVKIDGFNNKFWYVLDFESVKKYFRSQDFKDTAFNYYSNEFKVNLLEQKIWFYKLFINYPIGLCDIFLYDVTTDEDLISFKINITSAKIDVNEFKSLVSYIESRGISIWTKKSLVKHTADRFNLEDKTEWLITFCEFFIAELEAKHLHYFAFDKIKVIRPRNKIVSYSLDVNTSEESLFWLVNNLDILRATNFSDVDKIIVNNRLFSPSEILSTELEECLNTNENQLIHGFISELTHFFTQLHYQLEDQIKKYSRTRFEEIVDFYSNTRSLKRVKKILQNLTRIKFYFEKYIPVESETLDFLYTNKIDSKEHYSYVYNNLVEWLVNKDAIFSKDKKLFKGITRMDHLFERACFFKLVDSFEKIGFEKVVINFDENDFPCKVKLSRKGVVHYLYFEIIPETLITIRKDSGRLKPDFFIELENGHFVIIDAKYKKATNIVKYDYQDLVLKYLHGIGYKNGGFFNPLGLFVLFPSIRSDIDFYQKKENNLFGDKPAFPSIGNIALNFEEESKLLDAAIQKILEIN
jgi:hypothetical protein